MHRRRYVASRGTLRVLLFDPGLEEELLGTIEGDTRLLTDGRERPVPVFQRIIDSLKQLIGSNPAMAMPVLLCPSPARYYLRRWLEAVVPRVTVLSPAEIPPEVRLRPVGTVR